jgi:hypothetical protein
LNRSRRLGVSGTSGPYTGARSNRMQSAFAFGIALLDCRASARSGRLPRIERLAGLGFGDS